VGNDGISFVDFGGLNGKFRDANHAMLLLRASGCHESFIEDNRPRQTLAAMASHIRTAKATLSYPLFACDFDPNDSGYLVVGGGGGEGRSGVDNKIVSITYPTSKLKT
jgi:hypothetical protein